jgi:hypothetical protein
VTTLGVDADQEGVRVIRELVLQLGDVLERVQRHDAVVVVGGEEHRRRVRRLGRVDVVQRRIPVAMC